MVPCDALFWFRLWIRKWVVPRVRYVHKIGYAFGNGVAQFYSVEFYSVYEYVEGWEDFEHYH